MNADDLIQAVDAALAGDWCRARCIVQRDEHWPLPCWLHAVLHEIKGDVWNSRYWYARTPHGYEDWSDAKAKLKAIRAQMELSHG